MIKGKNEVFADQIALAHSDHGWFPTLQEAIHGLTEEQVWLKDGANHSIGELITHLTYWNEKWLDKFMHEESHSAKIGNDQTFDKEATGMANDTWPEIVDRLNAVMSAWKEQLTACDESVMYEPIPGQPNAKWWEALSALTTHNVYHLGQMITLRKQQGNWKR